MNISEIVSSVRRKKPGKRDKERWAAGQEGLSGQETLNRDLNEEEKAYM